MTLTHPDESVNALKNLWSHTPPELRQLLSPVQNHAQYQHALNAFEKLLSEVEGNPDSDPHLTELVGILGEHLRTYEGRDPLPAASGRDLLKFLMEQHDLKQSDLPEVGSQGVISEILSGKRTLNIRQATALGQRFRLNHTAFLR